MTNLVDLDQDMQGLGFAVFRKRVRPINDWSIHPSRDGSPYTRIFEQFASRFNPSYNQINLNIDSVLRRMSSELDYFLIDCTSFSLTRSLAIAESEDKKYLETFWVDQIV